MNSVVTLASGARLTKWWFLAEACFNGQVGKTSHWHYLFIAYEKTSTFEVLKGIGKVALSDRFKSPPVSFFYILLSPAKT